MKQSQTGEVHSSPAGKLAGTPEPVVTGRVVVHVYKGQVIALPSTVPTPNLDVFPSKQKQKKNASSLLGPPGHCNVWWLLQTIHSCIWVMGCIEKPWFGYTSSKGPCVKGLAAAHGSRGGAWWEAFHQELPSSTQEDTDFSFFFFQSRPAHTPIVMCYLTTGPNSIKSTNHILKTSRQWAKTNLSSLLKQLSQVFCYSCTELTKTWQSSVHTFNFQHSVWWHRVVPLSEPSCPGKRRQGDLNVEGNLWSNIQIQEMFTAHIQICSKLRYRKVLPKNEMVRRGHFTRININHWGKNSRKEEELPIIKQCLKDKEWMSSVYEISFLGISEKKNHPKISKYDLQG